MPFFLQGGGEWVHTVQGLHTHSLCAAARSENPPKLPCAQLPEVFCRLGADVRKQLNLQPPNDGAAHADVCKALNSLSA